MQQDTHKTNIKLLDELRELRQRNSELEAIVSNVKESEERFKAIANYSFDWESWIGTDGKLIWINPAVEKFTGYSAEEYLNLPDRFNQIIWDGDRDRIFSHIENGVQKHQSDNDVEFQIRSKDGSLKWVSASYQPMYTETGECLGLRSSIRDISKRKLADQALQESQEHFRRAIAEASVDAIYTVDQNGTIVFWNKAAAKIFGYEENEALGRSNTMLLPKRFKERDSKARKQLLDTGVYSFENKLNESVAVRRDGTEFPVEITISGWKANNRQYFTAILRDITERKQQEEALRESEERFKAVAASSPDAILISDQNGAIIFWNNAAAEMFGYEERGIVGKSYTMLLPERLRDQDQKAGQKFSETGRLSSNKKPLETIALRKDGREFPIEITFSGWKVAGQYCFSFIMRDISERKQHEAMLKNSEARFRSVAETSSDAIYISDQNGAIIFWNNAAAKIFGYEEKDILGKSSTILMPRSMIPEHSEAIKELIQKGTRLFMSKPIEAVAVRKGGTEFPVEIAVSSWKIKERYYFSTILRDISERKQQEEALKESAERFRAIAESSSDAMLTVDSSGKILFWNKAAETVYGYSSEEIVGKSVEILRPKGKRFMDRKSRDNFIKTGHSPYVGKAAEGRALKKDGTEFLTETSISSWEIADQVYFSGIVRDITERKRMETELLGAHDELEKKVKQRTVELSKTNKELQAARDYLKKYSGKLLATREEERRNISTTLHDELGSMSVSVGSKISIAKEELKENNAKAALKYLEQGETVLRKAVADIRKLAVDLRPPSLENMGLSAALRDYIETIKKHSKIRITFQNDLGHKKILGATAIAIYRVAQEAVTNISKHSQAKKVRVRLYADNKNIKLNITDDGVGFDVEKIYSYSKRGRFKMGILGMKERIESLGGVLVIKSILRKGTLIKASLPKE